MSIFDDMLKAADEAEKAAAATKPAAPVKPPPVATKPVAEGAVKAALPATPAVTEPAKPVKTDLEKIFAEGLAEADKAAKAAAKAAKVVKPAAAVKPEPIKAKDTKIPGAPPEVQPIDWSAMYEASQIHSAKGGAARPLLSVGTLFTKAPERDEFAPVDIDAAAALAARKLGMTKDQFKQTAELQGVSLDSLYRAAVNKIPYDQVVRANQARGVLGFMSPTEREAAATKIAVEAERASRGDAGDAPIALKSAATKAKTDFLGTSAKLPEVTREGEHGYGIATMLVEALKKDPKAVRIFDRYSRMTTGGATQQYIDDRVKDLAESKNITPDTPGFDDKVKALRRQATREVIAYKTVGLWTPVIVLGETEVREGLRDPDLISAFKPGAEIIGFDNKNQAVFRQESALSTVFRAIDAPKSAVVEIGREIANKGIENADIAGAAARGVRAGTSLVEVSQDITEGAPLPVKLAAGAVGLAADIFSPDAVFVGGKAIRALTTAAKGAGRVAEFAVLKSSAARGATRLAQEVVDLAETGDLAGAARKEAELRKQFPGVARAADQYDAFMARLIAAAYDDTRHLDNTLMDDIASIVPDAESPASRVGLHASQRFAEQAGKTKGGRRVSVLPYQEAYDVERHAQAIERDRARFLTQTPSNPEVYMERFAGNYAGNLVAPAVRGGAIKTTTANKVAAILKSEMPLLKADPKAWGDKIRAAIKADADLGTDANKKLRETLYKRAIPAVQRRAATVFTNYPAWYASQIQLFDDAQKAVSINHQSRIAGFKTVVRALNAGGYVDPIPEDTISILRGKLGSTAQPSLSTQGRAFFVDLLAASRRPQVSIEDAYQQAQVVDQAAAAWAKKNVSTVDEYYKRYGLRARRAQAPSPAPAPTPAPKPAAVVKPVARGKKAAKAAEVLEPTVPRAEVEPTVEVLEATVPRADTQIMSKMEAPPSATVADDLIRKLKNVDELTNEELLTELDGYNNFTLTRPYFEKRLAAATDDLARESVTRQLRLAVSQTRQRKAKELVARAELAEVARKVQEQLDARRTLDMDRVVPSVIPMSDEAKKTAVATRLWEGRTPVTAKGTIDLAEAESKLTEMPKLTQAVEYVRENTGNPFYKALAERLLRVGGRFDDASFGVAQAGQTVPSDVARALTGFYGLGGALGFTVSQKLADEPIRVWLRGSTIGGVGKASVEEVVLHEALHAATSERLFVGRYRAQKGTALYDAANNFLDLHQQVVEYVNTRRASGSASVYEADDFLSTTLNKPDEFLAYGMSDPEFQAYLATIPTRDAASPSLWTKFVDGVRSLIGLPASDTSALSRLIHASDKIMEIPEEAVTAARELANAPVSPAPIVSLMEAPADLTQAGKLAGDAERGAIDLSNKASVIIKLFRTADPSTALHEIGHLLRVTHLDDVDMASIASWLRSQGLNVGHRFGEFTGSATDVARAEEAFATAFEQFVREGVAPTADMKPALDALSGAVSAVYRGVANTPVGRALSPEARALFNKTLSAVDPEREVVRGIAQGQAAVKALEIPEGSLSYLSREAQRLGMPESTLEELAAKVDDVLPPIPKIGQKPAPAPSPSTVVIDFPAPVFGKTEYTLADLAKLDVELREKAALREATARPAKIDLRTGGEQVKGFTAAPGEIVEAAPVERLRSAVAKRDDENAFIEGARTLARGTVGLFFGGDVVTEKGLRDLPETIRRDLSIIPRRIEQALVDSTLLVEDARKSGEINNLVKYLAGSKAVATRGGRSLASSGDDMMGGFVGMIKRSFDGLTADQKQAVIELTAILNGSDKNRRLAEFGYDLNAAVELRRDAQGKSVDTMVEAVTQLLYRPKLGDQNIDIGQSMYESIRQAVGAHPDAPRPNYEFDLVESMLYTAGITSRNGKFIAGGSEEAARTFLKEASTIYQDDAVGRRLAVTVAGYGQAQIAKKRLAGLGLLMDEATVEAFKAWQVGGSVPVDMLPKVDELIRRVGQNPEFVRDPILDTTFYVPKQARELMADALTKVRVTTGSRDVGADLIRSVLASRKTSMTRGTLVVKPRYFMMNTIDHYNQMAMIVGYGAAAQSAARVVAQDLMMVPYISQLVGVVARTGVISPTALEKARIGIQKGGDRVAWLIGAMFSASKYRIEVNPILEGARGMVRVGDKVYEQREIRNIATEEGIFATFSSREFQKTIYAEGVLFFDGQSFVTSGAIGAKLPTGAKKVVNVARDAAYALEDVVQDLAEAWSERERLGAMITLMEQGIPPRQAARLVVDALFDYSQSLSKGDRNMLLGAFFPFWSFQKNANTVVANLMLSSPEGAYRMMCIRRAQEGFAELASELMYGEVGGEYGVNVDNLPPDLQETYYSIISDVASAYPGKPIPEDVKSALRILFRGRTGNIVVEGKEVQLSPELLRLESSGAFRKFAMEGYAVPRPERSGLPSYLRDLPAITFPLERDASTRGYLSLLNDDGAYAALFIPENTIAAGMKHMLGVTAGLVSLGSSAVDMISVGGLDTSDATNALEAAARAVQPALDIERTPLAMAAMSAAGVSGGAPGMKLDPWIGQLVQMTYNVSLVRAPAKYDAVIDKVMRGETEGIDPKIIAEIRELQKTNPDLATARDERYYLPNGLWTEAFRAVTPLYELNAFLLRLRTTPLEKANRQAYMLRWLRNVAGFTTAEVVPDKTARQEEPTRLKPTKEM